MKSKKEAIGIIGFNKNGPTEIVHAFVKYLEKSAGHREQKQIDVPIINSPQPPQMSFEFMKEAPVRKPIQTPTKLQSQPKRTWKKSS